MLSANRVINPERAGCDQRIDRSKFEERTRAGSCEAATEWNERINRRLDDATDLVAAERLHARLASITQTAIVMTSTARSSHQIMRAP
jgi:hypothetical protein